MTRVSVVITTFNQASYIGEALGSVLVQTYPLHQIILVDDGSRDDTRAVVAPYRDRIRYVRQANHGVAGARNAGVAAADGDLIAFLDGDDVWAPDKVERQVAAAAAYPAAALIATDGVEFEGEQDLGGHLLGRGVRERLAGRVSMEWDCYDSLVARNLIPTTSQVAVPRWALERVGASDRRYATGSDWDLYLRLARDHPFAFVAERLVRWRYVSGSASGAGEQRVLRWAVDELSILRRERSRGRAGRADMIQRAMDDKSRRTAYAAYLYGEARDRAWARRYLVNMWRRQGSDVFLLYLAASFVPPALRGAFGGLRRRVLGV